jgi:hypothetical protein
LRELVLDWETALFSIAALSHATRLSRLVLDLPTDDTVILVNIILMEMQPGAGFKEQLVQLATMHGLRLVQFTSTGLVGTRLQRSLNTLWRELAIRSPKLVVEQVPDTNVGWTLNRLLPKLPHNHALMLLQ